MFRATLRNVGKANIGWRDPGWRRGLELVEIATQETRKRGNRQVKRLLSTGRTERKEQSENLFENLRALSAMVCFSFLPSIDGPEIEDMHRETSRKVPRPGQLMSSSQVEMIGESVSLRELNLRYKVVPGKKATTAIEIGFGDKKELQKFEIGTGAYGTVLKAMDGAGSFVAIKVVEDDAMKWENLKDEVEALLLARKHPNVNQLLEVLYCEETHCFYIVTEYCAGGELFDRLIDNGPYKEDSAARIIERVASSLRHIHESGYVHHDLKPENLLFACPKGTPLSDEMDIRLIDFGMTRRLEPYFRKGYLTITSSVGTTPYLSPEVLIQLRDTGRIKGKNEDISRESSDPKKSGALEQEQQQTVNSSQKSPSKIDIVLSSDPRACDLWALGVIAYILILGCHPFDRTGKASDLTIAERAIRGSIEDDGDNGRPPSERRFTFDVHKLISVSPKARDLISKLLDPNPKTRLTADQVLSHPWIREHTRLHGEQAPQCDANQFTQQTEKLSTLQSFQSTTGSHRAIATALLVASLAGQGHPGSTDAFLRKAYDILGSSDWADVLKSMGNVSEADRARITQGLVSFVDFENIVTKYHTVKFKAGDVVFAEGDDAHGLYLIVSGDAQIEYTGKGGSSTVVANVAEGDMFGETAILDGRDKRNATVRCTSDVQAVFFSREEFVRTLGVTAPLCTGLEEYIRGRQNARARHLLLTLGAKKLQRIRFKAGDVLFEQNGESNMLYLINSGIVETFVTHDADGKMAKAPRFSRMMSKFKRSFMGSGSVSNSDSKFESDESFSLPLRNFRSGDLVGTNTVTGAPRIATAICKTNVEVHAVSKADLDELVALESSLHRNLLRLARRDMEDRTNRFRGAVSPSIDLVHRGNTEIPPEELRALLIQSLQSKLPK